MATHDYVISNASGAAVRADLNNAFAAIVSNNSSATEPSTTYAYQWWADTGSSPAVMKLRNAANSAWITLFQLDGEWSTLSVENGTAAAPSIYFKDSGTDTGFFSGGTDQVNITTGGTERVEWGASEVVFNDGGENYDFRVEGDTNANLLIVDASADKIGINDTAPDALLTVNGVASFGAGTVSAPSIAARGDLNTGVFFPAADTIAFAEGGAEAARIDSSGRLLVGTSTARANFFNSTVSAGVQVEGTTTDNASLSITRNSNSADNGMINFAKTRGTTVGGTTVVSSGDCLGAINFMGSDGTEFVNAASIEVLVDATPGSNDMPGRLSFSVTADGASSPTERMRITSNGLHRHHSAEGVFRANSSQGAGTTYELFWGGYGGSSTTVEGTNSIKIYTNGNIQNTNNSYGSLSDSKLKENIVDANSQWDDLKALQVRKYNFKEGQTHTQIGLIAQEVELVSPGLVYEFPDRDEDGNDLGTVTKSVNYSVLYMKAVKALQEAMERIETLEAKVAALEAA